MTNATYLANRAIYQCASYCPKDFLMAASIIQNDFYFDDLISGYAITKALLSNFNNKSLDHIRK